MQEEDCLIGSLIQRCAQLRCQFPERLRNDRRACQHWHEIRVALPAWDDVNMQMFHDASTGDLSEVDTDIKSIRFHHLRQGVLAPPSQQQKVGHFLVGKLVEIRGLFVGHYQQMAPGIRVAIEQGIACSISRDDVVVFIFGGLGNPRKKTFGQLAFWRQDILDPPGRMQ